MGEDDAAKDESSRPATLIARAKPAAPASVHLMLAALMWSVVGSAMIVFGTRWVWLGPHPWLRWVLAVAAALGVLKSRLVLDRAAGRIAARITARGDGRCIGGVLSPRTWLLVVVMAAGGRWLRSGHLARPLVGLLYVAVGTALLLSCRVLWRAWRDSRRPPGMPAPV
jgi:hypothetical protein